MKTENDIHDLIQTAPVELSERAIRRLLDILTAMNDKIKSLEACIEREEIRSRRATSAGALDEYAHPELTPMCPPSIPVAWMKSTP